MTTGNGVYFLATAASTSSSSSFTSSSWILSCSFFSLFSASVFLCTHTHTHTLVSVLLEASLSAEKQTNFLLCRRCSLHPLFALGVFLLQLSFSFLQLVFLLQPLHPLFIRQPAGGDARAQTLCVCVWGRWRASPLRLLLAPVGLRPRRPQLLTRPLQSFPQTLVDLRQSGLGVRQRPQLDAQLLVLLLVQSQYRGGEGRGLQQVGAGRGGPLTCFRSSSSELCLCSSSSSELCCCSLLLWGRRTGHMTQWVAQK